MKKVITFLQESMLLAGISLLLICSAIYIFFTVLLLPAGKDYVTTDAANKFIIEAKSADISISKLKIYSYHESFYFDYTVRKDPDEESLDKDFNLTYNFLFNDKETHDSVIKYGKDVSVLFKYRNDTYRYDSERIVDHTDSPLPDYSNYYKTWKVYKNDTFIKQIKKT